LFHEEELELLLIKLFVMLLLLLIDVVQLLLNLFSLLDQIAAGDFPGRFMAGLPGLFAGAQQ